MDQLKIDAGIKSKYVKVPPRTKPKDSSDWAKLSMRHMTAVLRGRGEGDNINMIAEALHRCGYLEKLAKTERFVPIVKGIVRAAVAEVQDHWTPRHAVHVWDRLELSRSQMETLRHLLSFIYDPGADKYIPIKAYVNPNDDHDYVLVAKMASRQRREKEYQEIASTMNIVVGSNGRCERDAVECTSRLYSNYARALRDVYTDERPAQPVLFLDGTGGALGRGICHGTIGCADFKKVGDCDAKQSRATLQPLFLYQGNDHAMPLRENLDLAISSYNRLVGLGCFDCDRDGTTECIPARPITAADMQGAKTTYGMRECSHSVWCKCRRREGGSHHVFSAEPKATYAEMIDYVNNEIGCHIKTYEELCSWAHYDPGVAKGGSFTGFTCSCCGYAPTEAVWRADLAAWHLLDDDDRNARRAVHMDVGDELNSHSQHYHQELFMPPLTHHGMDRCGVDQLHLVFLNLFKHMFKYTVHEGLPETKKKLIGKYVRDMGFYSYDAASLDDDPCSHWIGREVKRFLNEAHLHLPFLLQIAAAPADVCAEMAATANVDGEMEMAFDDEYAPTAEEIAAEEKLEPLMMLNAQRWDDFLDYVRDMTAEWPQGAEDTDEYRQGRALSAFNFGTKVASNLLELKPTFDTWVPHIMCYIVPRQMVPLGDPSRRSCDACESFGAMLKKIIKHSTCRRKVKGTEETAHIQERAVPQDCQGPAHRQRWKQTFNVGFIEQAFKRACVRESLQHGAANAAYKQRRDHRRTTCGKSTVVSKLGKDVLPTPLVYEACEEYCKARQAGPSTG